MRFQLSSEQAINVQRLMPNFSEKPAQGKGFFGCLMLIDGFATWRGGGVGRTVWVFPVTITSAGHDVY